MTDTPLPDRDTLEQVDESRIYAYDPGTGTYVTLESDGNGNLYITGSVSVSGTVSVQEDTPLDVSGATVPVQESTPLDVSAATVSADVTDQQGRNLGKARLMDSGNTLIDPATETTLTELSHALASTGATNQDSFLVDSNSPLDVSGAKVSTDPDTDDFGSLNGAALSGNGSVSVATAAQGAEKVEGRAVSSGSYDVKIDWEDSAGNVLFTTTVASAVAGGTETNISEPTDAPYATVKILDASGASQTATLAAHMR